MKLTRHSLLAALLVASGLVFSMLGNAYAQRAMYRTVSGHGYGHGCPCPTDCEDSDAAPAPEGAADDMMGEDLPEVADLTSDAAFAGGSQSAAPLAIGDSNYPGFFVSGLVTVDPAGGRRYKATHNNSAVPQCRAYFDFNYYNNSLRAGTQEIDTYSYEVGGEYAFWCGMASIQVNVPVIDQFAGDQLNAFPFATDTQLGNVQVALKTVLLQDCCQTVSAGVGFDLPTADDFNIASSYGIENDVVLVSPFVALLRNLDACTYVQSFAQVQLPTDANTVSFGPESSIHQPTLLYLDMSVGRWLCQDCCGNGVVAVGELHYTNALSDDSAFAGGILVGDYELLNATMGVSVIQNCWSITPALVLPILDGTDRAFDYEIACYINRRF